MVSAIIYLYRWLSKLIKRGGKVMEERYQNWLEATKFKLSKPKFSLSGGIALRPFQLLASPPPSMWKGMAFILEISLSLLNSYCKKQQE